jgi:hypothetical protein
MVGCGDRDGIGQRRGDHRGSVREVIKQLEEGIAAGVGLIPERDDADVEARYGLQGVAVWRAAGRSAAWRCEAVSAAPSCAQLRPNSTVEANLRQRPPAR